MPLATGQDSNTTFIDREARNAVLREAAEHGRMLPGHRTMGHPPIPHRKLQGSPGSMSSNVPEPSLLDTNPEVRHTSVLSIVRESLDTFPRCKC